MTSGVVAGKLGEVTPRVGLFGHLGVGNIGNNAGVEVMLRYLSTDHPEVVLDAMCSGPARLARDFGIEAIPLHWFGKYQHRTSGVSAIALKVLGKGIDAVRTASWVRRHDVVIVPGGGVLENSLPMRPWGFPYAMFLLSASGKLFGTKVALVSVGATVTSQRMTGWLYKSAARLAFYRSYRDVESRAAMQQMGVDTTRDHVYPDLVFAIPVPPQDPGDAQTVGVGVMAYYGTNDERGQADELHTSYVTAIKSFVRWLIDNGRKVRLFVGDTDGSDDSVVQEILADLRECRPDLDPAQVVAESASSLAELMPAMAAVDTVVATRYHNVLCALMLSKPTISIEYAPKNSALMGSMGLSEFCQFASTLDAGRLIEQFTELESRSAELGQVLTKCNAVNVQLLRDQFVALSANLFPEAESAPDTAEHSQTRGSDS